MNAKICCGFLLAACASALAFAQTAPVEPEPCSDAETVIGCFSRIQAQAAPESTDTAIDKVEEQLKDDVKQELAIAQTGADSGGSTTASSVSDLAQFLNILGLVSSGDTEDSKLSVDLNFLLPMQDVENNNAQLKAVINPEAEPLDELVQAFGETVREARKDSLQKGISTFGDTQISFTWSLVNNRFGRDYSVLRNQIAPLNAGAVARGKADATQEMRSVADLPELIQRINAERAAANPPQPSINAAMPLGSFSNDLKDRLKTAAYKAAVARTAVTRAIQNELVRSGASRLAELVEQQPQLLFSLRHDIRDDIVGPDRTAATVTWEMTRRNFGAFMRGEGRACTAANVAEGGTEYDACTKALTEYLSEAAMSQQWRAKVEASYKRVKALSYAYPDDNVNLLLPKQDRWEVAVGAGRALSQDKNGGRLDLALSYDSNLDNDSNNKERVKATVTYTRRVGDVDLPFSLVYANKDEFLGELDHQISMNFGLRFRQPKK